MFTLTVHELFAGMVPPVGDPKVKEVALAAGAQVGDPPHVVEAEGVAATCRPVGRVSVNVTPVKAIEFELERVKVNVDMPFTAIGSGENALVIVGGTGVAQPVKFTLSRLRSFPLEVAFAPYP